MPDGDRGGSSAADVRAGTRPRLVLVPAAVEQSQDGAGAPGAVGSL